MKSLFLISFLFVSFSCAHGPDMNRMSKSELTDFVMRESMLTTALSSASASALNCMQPFEKKMDRSVYIKLSHQLRKSFKYESMYSSIHGRIMNGHDHTEMKHIAETLDGKIWQKYLEGIEAAANGGQDKFIKIYQSLDAGLFDLTNQRSQLVARITDYSFMLNLVSQSNSQVMQLLQMNMPARLGPQQSNILDWINNELINLNNAHIKTLFVTAYLATEKFSKPELEALLSIRKNTILVQGRVALESELSHRYQDFLANFKKTAETSQR